MLVQLVRRRVCELLEGHDGLPIPWQLLWILVDLVACLRAGLPIP